MTKADDRAFPSKAIEDETVARAKRGDRGAVELLYRTHLPHARDLIRSVYNGAQQADRDDLEQEAYLGLVTAIQRFEPDRGLKFITYASWWMYSYIMLWLRRQRKPQNQVASEVALGGAVPKEHTFEAWANEEDYVIGKLDSERYAAALAEATRELTEQQRAVLERHVDDGEQTQRDLGYKFGVSGARVGQIERQAIQHVRFHEAIKALRRGEP